MTHRSIALEADSKHLMVDLRTSVGVVIGVLAVQQTRWYWVDPVVAILVAVNIMREGLRFIYHSVQGLMDRAIAPDDQRKLEEAIRAFENQGVRHQNLRTRTAGALYFVTVDILVPGAWSVTAAHDVLDQIEARIRAAIPQVHITTHLEPL